MTTPYTAPGERWNVLAIVGFVLSLLGFNIVAIVLGFVGLSQIKRTGEKGRGLALAAVIIGIASIVLGILFIALLLPLIIAGATDAGVNTNY